MTARILCCLALTAWSLAALGHEPASLCEEAVTVFHDVSKIGRKDRAAANMTRRHEEMAAQGWRFADAEPYIENSDLEGLFITYVRRVVCPAALNKDD
jgi:hypothetical protein